MGASTIISEGEDRRLSPHFERVGPLDGEAATTAIAASVDDARMIADAAAAAFPAWSQTGPGVRRALLLKAAEALESRRTAFVEAMLAETGATPDFAHFNIMLATLVVREAAAITTQIVGEVIPSDKPGCFAMALREPAGVVLGFAPWNAPIVLAARAIAVPLACGNTVILKASELCPQTHALVIEAFHEAGFPRHVVNLVAHPPADAAEIAGALIDHPAVARISFTGSTATGRIIARRAALNLKPVILELGGKAPLIILEDADLDEAVSAAAFGAFMNQGQVCMSTERVIAVDAVADEVARRLAAKAAAIGVGDPREGGAPLSCVIDQAAMLRINALIADAVDKGATLVTGGPSDSVMMPPVVLDHVTGEMAIYRDESFGPVVGIIRARDGEDAVRIANDSDYGLSAAIFTADLARGLRLARRIRSGICHINGPTLHDEPQMPFGGCGASGYGRFGGKAGIDAFTELRWITIQTEPGCYPF